MSWKSHAHKSYSFLFQRVVKLIKLGLFPSVQDKTELVQLQESIFQSRKESLHKNVVTVVTQAEIWGNANERDLSQALQYKYDALKDRLLRDALVQQLGVTEWAALSENDRNAKLAQMKIKVQALQSEGSVLHIDINYIIDVTYIEVVTRAVVFGLSGRSVA